MSYFCQWCYDRGLRYPDNGKPWAHAIGCPHGPAAATVEAVKCPACKHEWTPTKTTIAREMGRIKTPARAAASRANGSAPPKPGSKPRGRPRIHPVKPSTPKKKAR